MAEPRAAHRERGGERDRLVVLAGQRRRAARDVHVGRRSTPASLNSRSSAGRGDRAARRRTGRLATLTPPPRSSTSLSASTSARRRPPGEHAAGHAVDHRRVGPGHPAQEQVEHAGEVALGVVAGQPPAQVAVQRDRVEQRLQRVVRALHLGGERRRAVVPGGQRLAGRREPVGLVVDDGVARRRTRDDEVDAAGQVAAHAAGAAPGRRAGPRSRRAGRRAELRRAARRAIASSVEPAGRAVAAGERQLEVELVEAVGAREVAQPRCRRAAGRAASRSPRAARRRPSPGRRCRRAGAPDARRRARRARRRGRPRRSRSPRARGARTCRRATPAGMSPSSDGDGAQRGVVAPRAPTAATAASRLVGHDAAPRARSPTRASYAPAVMSLYDVRRQRRSSSRSKRAAASSAGARSGPVQATRQRRASARSTLMQPGACGGERLEALRSPPRRSASCGPPARTVPSRVAREQQAPERRVAAVARARPPDDRLVARARQRDVGEPQVLAALLDHVLALVAAEVGPVERRRRSSRRRRRPGRGRRPAAARSGCTPAPTGTGSRRSGTRGPCCGGSSAPGPPRRRTPGGGCGPRRRCPAPASAIRRRSHAGQRGRAELLGRRGGVQQLADVAQVGQPALAVGGARARARAGPRRSVIVSASEATPLSAQHARPVVQAPVDLLPVLVVARSRRAPRSSRGTASAPRRARGGVRSGARAPPAAAASRAPARCRTRCPRR